MSRLMTTAGLLLTVLACSVYAQDPASADTFEREMIKALKSSHAQKRSVVVHIGGEAIAGAVKAIGPDVVVLSNREHATILLRRDQIEAVEAD